MSGADEGGAVETDVVDVPAEPEAQEAIETEDGANFGKMISLSRLFSRKTAFADEAEEVLRTKTFTYTIREVDESKPGYTIDGHELVYIVTVTDTGEGKLDVSYVSQGDDTFINTYKAEGTATFEGDKSVTGNQLKDGQFSFELKDVDNNVLQTVTNSVDGSFAFDAITYTEADAGKSFDYQIVEVNDGQTGYTYDSHVCDVTVTVSDNGDGTLAIEVKYSDGEAASFTNPYSPNATSIKILAKKVMKGRDLKAGEFNFELSDSTGKVIAKATNAADGTVDFGTIEYKKAGTYTYTARELPGTLPNVTYDTSVKTYTVTVKDVDGKLEATVTCSDPTATFTNVYKPGEPGKPGKPGKPGLPKTGDPAAGTSLMMYAAAGMATLLTGFNMRRKRK